MNFGKRLSVLTRGAFVAAVIMILPATATTVDVNATYTGITIWGSDYNFGSSNPYLTLTISGGGSLTNITSSETGFGFRLGVSSAASNETVIVTGANSTLGANGNSVSAFFGHSSKNNSTTASAGGVILVLKGSGTCAGSVGELAGADNNSLTITGSGSRYSSTAPLTIGNGGSSCSLTVSNGGYVVPQRLLVGATATATNNSVTITGIGSSNTVSTGNNSIFEEGSVAGANANRVSIVDGGIFRYTGTGTGRNFSIGKAGSDNYLEIKDAGSALIVTYSLPIGIGGQITGVAPGTATDGGSGNHLDIFNDGSMTANNSVYLMGTSSAFNLGNGAGVSTATVGKVTGFIGGVYLKNADGRLNFNRGKLIAGATAVDALVSGAGKVQLNGPAYISTTVAGSTIGSVISGGGAGSITKQDSGTLTLTAVNDYTGTTIIEAGTLALAATGTINNSPVIQSTAGTAVFDVSAYTPYSLPSGQSLKGIGQVKGNVAMASGSKLIPGNSHGILTFQNNLTLLHGATNYFELGPNTTPGSDYDQVVVQGTLDVNGLDLNDLSLTNDSGFTTGVYILFDATTLSGSLGATTTGTLGGSGVTLSLDVLNNNVILTVSGGGDTTPPSPDPMTFATPPAATGPYSISMTASTASDASLPVEYFFTNTVLAGHYSGWTNVTTWVDTGLTPSTLYTYTVKARDAAAPPNETVASGGASVSTMAPDTTPPTPDPMTWASVPSAAGPFSITMTATTASDLIPPIQYFFTNTTLAGHSSGWTNVTTWVDNGLVASTVYSYKVQARDSSPVGPNVTAFSTPNESATTDPDLTAPTPDPMTFATAPFATGAHSISMTASTASDPSGVEYFFTGVTSGHNSGWTNATTWEDTGLAANTAYSYTVKARDKSAAHNETAVSTPPKSATTTVDGVWTQTLTGRKWNNTANWSGGDIPSGIGSLADFITIDVVTDPFVVHLDMPATVGNLTFGDTDTGSAASWTFDNTGVPGNVLTLSGAITPKITVNALGTGKDVTISGIIDGINGVAKEGAGALTLTAVNTYGGGTFLNAGTLNVNAATALASGTLTLNGGALDNTSAGWLVVPPSGGLQITMNADCSFIGTQNLTLGNGASQVQTMSLGPSTGADRTFTINNGILTIGAMVEGTSNRLVKEGPGELYFNRTGSGGTPHGWIYLTVKQGKMHNAGSHGGAWGPNGITLGDSTPGNTKSASLATDGGDSFSNPISVSAGSVAVLAITSQGSPAWNSQVTLNNNVTLAALGGGNSLRFPSGSQLIGSGKVDIGNLGFINLGTVVLGGANTYTGDTTVNGGTLELNHVNALQNSTLDTGIAGAQQVTFTAVGTTYNIAGLKGADDLAIGANKIVVGANGSNTTCSGAITGIGGSFGKTGTGMLTLTGPSTYDSGTTISDGSLKLITGGSLGNTAIAVSGTGSLVVQTATSLDIGSTAISGAGATLDLGSRIFDMTGDNVVGTCYLKQDEATGPSPALTIANGATLKFNLGNTAADKLAVTKAAAVSGTVIVDIDTAGATALTGGLYDLITAAAGSGLNSATWQFADGLTTKTVTVGSSNYTLTLSATDTAVRVTVAEVVPLPDTTVIKFQ